MNGPTKMYRTRQIIRHDLPVSLPNCMYKLKNIHATSDPIGPLDNHVSPFKKSVDISEQVKQFLKNLQDLPEMSALINRQQKILQQLDALRQQMITLKSDLGASNGPVTTKVLETTFTCPLETYKLPNIIINASPTHPPYSLLLVQKLWKSYFNLQVTSHLHSTVSSLPEKAAALMQALQKCQAESSRPTIELKLIWKNVGPDPELIISQVPIVGEANILRYLSRISPELLQYETSENVFEIDSVLDICYCIVRSRTKTERSSLIQSLNKKLGKSEWLCGHSKITIADIAASSAIKQSAENELNQNMAKWMQRCNAIVT